MDNHNQSGVLVYIEQKDLEIAKVSIELLGIGKELANKRNTYLACVVIGEGVTAFAEDLVHQAVDKVYVVDHEILRYYRNETYTLALSKVIKFDDPEIVLVGATALGRDLAPRVSSRIHTGLTADCTSLDIDPETGGLLMTRPAFGGNLMATIVCPNHRPQMSTVRPGVMIPPVEDLNYKGEVILFDAELSENDIQTQIIGISYSKKEKKPIEDANVLVSAGRGIGNKDNMKYIYELASLLGGEVSGTRAVIDTGWLDKDQQVGQTGKTVRPDLYFACGISGAIQHVSGMENSGYIVSINKNPNAPIFEVSDLGIVGDASKVIPKVIEELKRMKP
ncbi:MAG: electron transfer flavoprotein subunit alpha/FixB family protein [Candidatus Izemoplasmatales bacterium]